MFETFTFTGLELTAGAVVFAALCVFLFSMWQRNHMNYHSSRDSLTGLIHRREFEKRLKGSLDSAHKEGKHHALLYMDVDQFRVVNENFGHQAGDELLIQLSALLRVTVRGDDKLARLGGDEFSVLLEDCPLDEAANKADDFKRAVEEFNFVWQEKTFDVGLGIGVVAIDSSSGSVNEILKSANSACYAAKQKGRNQVVIYQADDPQLKKQRGEMKWATRISDALRDQKFQLYYQDILPIQEEEPEKFHCELLMRTENDSHDLVSPMEFIPAAERFNLMGDIDRWVASTAIQNITVLEKDISSEKTSLYGINLSGQSLGDELFLDYVSGLFEVYDINPQNICFEVTESTAIVNPEKALKFMQEMKSIGCKFALDDFGTGISSFSYLKMFPFDFVKIDGSFIRNITTSEVDREMVASVCRIAKVLGIKTIAEYVEDDTVFARLRNLGVDYAQGYGISEPAPLSQRLSDPLSDQLEGSLLTEKRAHD
jgi:diguanylate cyclase (GGDEF)-like protein